MVIMTFSRGHHKARGATGYRGGGGLRFGGGAGEEEDQEPHRTDAGQRGRRPERGTAAVPKKWGETSSGMTWLRGLTITKRQNAHPGHVQIDGDNGALLQIALKRHQDI